MSEQTDANGAVNEQTVAPEAKPQSLSTEAESVAAESNDSLNSVASETSEGSAQRDEAWYIERNKQLSAENARRRDKAKKDAEKRDRLKARIEELEKSRPTAEQFGGDYDALQRAERMHDTRMVMADEALMSIDAQPVDTGSEAIKQANEAYIDRVSGYLKGENAVSQQAYQAKEQLFNEFLMNRSADEQALIIRELSHMDNPAEVVMNVADSPQALNELATNKSLLAVGDVLRSAKPPKREVETPAPVPEINGSVSGVSGEHDRSTREGIRAVMKELGIR